jgi:hypothetical protein
VTALRTALPPIGWKPREGQELLLRAALAPPDEAAVAWQKASAVVDVDKLDGRSHDVLPLLYRALGNAGVEDPWLPRLKGVYRKTWYENQLLLQRLARALSALGADEIDSVVLGGAVLGVLHYRDSGARPMDDTTIAVPAPAWRRACEVLASTDWSLRAVQRAHEDVRRAAVPFQTEDARALAPCASDELLRICVRGISWTSRPRSARWIADALVIVSASEAEIDWERLLRRAGDTGVASHLAVVFGYLSETYDAPIPQRVVASLRQAMTPGGRARVGVARARAFIHSLHSP